jgi:hypothetical protein
MTGAPTGAAPAPQAPDIHQQYKDLLFQESVGTLPADKQAALGRLRQSGKLTDLDSAIGEAPAAPAAAPPAGAAPTFQPNADYAPGGILAPPAPPARNFADSLSDRLGHAPIPGEAPNSGTLGSQAYRILNRAIGAFQQGYADESKPGSLPGQGETVVRGPGGIPVDVNPGPLIAGIGKAVGWGNAGAPVGAAVEAGTGSRGAGSAAEVATNLAPLLVAGAPRLLQAMPSQMARKIGAMSEAVPGMAEEAVTGGKRLAGELLKDTKAAQQASRMPADVNARSYTLSTTPEPPLGPQGQAPGIAKLRTATRATGEPSIIPADVPTELSAARNVAGGKETALQDFQKWLSKAEGNINPATQQKYLEKAMSVIDTHFPGAQLPELDQLRAATKGIGEMSTKMAQREKTIRRLGRTGLALYGIDRLAATGQSIATSLSHGQGGPGAD